MNNISITSQDSVRSQSLLSEPANFTRHSVDLVAKFKQQRRWHLIPLYHLLRLSDFGREGIERSGSYRFADHLYCNEPSGRGWMGTALDRILLNMPAAKGMRQRYVEAIRTMENWLDENPGTMRVLALPCGIPRDVSELLRRRPELASRIEYVGMDLDQEVVDAAAKHLRQTPIFETATVMQGNALDAETYPEGKFDVILSTGLGEFLDDQSLNVFYHHVQQALKLGGVFYTSATKREWKSDYLLRAFELETNYRDLDQARAFFLDSPWQKVIFEQSPSKLQTFIRAFK